MISIAQFREDATALLESHWPRVQPEGEFVWGAGSDDVAIFGDRTAESELVELKRARAWQAVKFDNGFGWISGPEQYGGRGLPIEYTVAYREVEMGFQLPDQIFFGVGQGMVAPTILAEGSEELRRRYLAGIYRGDLMACQLFSEPSAGSDLANVSALAIKDGDDWVVSGQKVWTSGAQYSDVGLLLVKTDRTVPNHQALTMFLVGMHADGVDVRPLRQMTGAAHFNEVFLENVRIPDTHRLGAPGEGWRVARTTLMNERASLGPTGSNAALGYVSLDRLKGLVRQFGCQDNPSVRHDLAQIAILARVADLTTRRFVAQTPAGAIPGPEMSACKLLRTELVARTVALVTRILGPALTADTGDWGTYAWATYLLGAPGMRIGGGTDEIMRTILAERVLALPRQN
jgi:alkylation response protein AidB-like acyl-CoA dehydrogenase